MTKTLKDKKRKRGKHFLSGFETDNFLKDFFTDPSSIRTPTTNVSENADCYKIEMGIPDFEKDDLDLVLDKSCLFIVGFKRNKGMNKEENGKDKTDEPQYLTFRKTYNLPDNVDISNITSTWKDGILEINLPKKESYLEKPRFIRIK